jgi:hypothetical protein
MLIAALEVAAPDPGWTRLPSEARNELMIEFDWLERYLENVPVHLRRMACSDNRQRSMASKTRRARSEAEKSPPRSAPPTSPRMTSSPTSIIGGVISISSVELSCLIAGHLLPPGSPLRASGAADWRVLAKPNSRPPSRPPATRGWPDRSSFSTRGEHRHCAKS